MSTSYLELLPVVAKISPDVKKELSEARAGERVWISARAAAALLNIHSDTLGEWRRRSPPSGPAWRKGSGDLSAGANARVHYRYAEVLEWAQNQASRTSRQRELLAVLQGMEDRAREVQLLKQLKDQQRRKKYPSPNSSFESGL